MKRFIKKILLFAVTILGFNIVIFFFAKKHYYEDYRVYPDRTFTNFLLSDSHGLPLSNHLESKGIFNFSAGSDSYFDMKRKLSYLTHNGYTIDTLYITVDNHTLGNYRESNNNDDRSNIYASRNEYNSLYTYLLNRYVIDVLPVFKSKIRDVFSKYLQSVLFRRKTLKVKDWETLSNEQKTKFINNRYLTQFGNATQSELLLQTFCEIVSICEKNNIEIIGVKYPLVDAYLERIGDVNFDADSVLLSKNYSVLDFSSIFSEKQFLFSNQDHLNDRGGKELAKMWFKILNY